MEHPDSSPSALALSADLGSLTLKQQAFIDHYIGDCYGNGTEACRRAGYAGTAGSLSEQARDNLRNPVILACVRARVKAITGDADAILAELWRVASAPMNQFMVVTKPATYDVDGTKLDDMHVRVDYTSKIRALELIMRYNRMLEDKAPIEVQVKALVGIDVSRI